MQRTFKPDGSHHDDHDHIVDPVVVTEQDVRSEAARRMQALSPKTSQLEMATWDVQRGEAAAAIADEKTSTPLLSRLADSRELTIYQMAQVVLFKSDLLAAASGDILAAQERLLNTMPIPVDFIDDVWWRRSDDPD